MSTTTRSTHLIALFLAIGLGLGCGGRAAIGPEAKSTAMLGARAQPTTLTVGLYPYVPRPGQLKRAITAAWERVHPEVQLRFNSDWDGGYSNDPSGMDVFVFDAMYLDYFRMRGFLAAIPPAQVHDPEDFLPYAATGAQYDDKYYGLPMFGCANILFYRVDDAPVAAAQTLTELTSALGQCTYTSEIPPDKRGLMLDMAGGTTSASLYVDLVQSIDGAWPPVLPTEPSELNATAITESRSLLATASYYNATETPSNAPYGRAKWFSAGNGRALMAFTEAMASMSAATRETLNFRPFPLGDDPSAQPLFYSDLVGVSASSSQSALAVELANLMSSTEVLKVGMESTGDEPPQFLMPVRSSLFDALATDDPIYSRMQNMVDEADPILFNLGPTARNFIRAMKDPIREKQRSEYACGCDRDAGKIQSQQQADRTCPTVCKDYGGWNGQWTPYPPGGTNGWSGGCGCMSCPAPQ